MWQKAAGKIWRALPVWGRRTLIRLTQPSFTVSAGVIVIDAANRVLLLNHVLRPASGWGVPGGFLDPGEQPADTARREVLEETGLELSEIELVTYRTLRNHVEFWFKGRADGEPQIKTKEILEARWFALDEIPPQMSRGEVNLIKQTVASREKAVV